MAMVPYLRAVFKPSLKVNELHPPVPSSHQRPPFNPTLCRGFTLSGEARKGGAKEGQDELVGFLRGESCNIYARAERILA